VKDLDSMTDAKPFECRYTLDIRADHALVQAVESAAFAIQDTFAGAKFQIRMREDGLPADPWQVWIIYLATLTFGAAQSLVTLILHNLGREARIVERAMYEYVERATYYGNHHHEAWLEFLSHPFRELKLLNQLGYDKMTAKYRDVTETVEHLKTIAPDIAAHAAKNDGKELGFSSMVEKNHKGGSIEDYAFHYRMPSQTAHGSVLGLMELFQLDGTGGPPRLEFNSQQADPNHSLIFGLKHLVEMMTLMAATLPGTMAFDAAEYHHRYTTIGARLYPGTS
jgi:hypothetical protein